MAIQSALETLIEISKKSSDELAKKLGQNLDTAKQAVEKLGVLQQFRDDYSNRLYIAMKSGINPDSYRNFTLFIAKLDDALIAQKRDVQIRQNNVNLSKVAWQESERKRLSFTTLQSRSDIALRRKESKAEQKASDEQASRISANNRTAW